MHVLNRTYKLNNNLRQKILHLVVILKQKYCTGPNNRNTHQYTHKLTRINRLRFWFVSLKYIYIITSLLQTEYDLFTLK